MPIISHGETPLPPPVDRVSERALASSAHGLADLRLREVVVHPGHPGRLHTHTTDQVIMVTAGAVQLIVGDEVQTVRSGNTLAAPAGVPHRVVNNLWVAATMLVIDATNDLSTQYLED